MIVLQCTWFDIINLIGHILYEIPCKNMQLTGLTHFVVTAKQNIHPFSHLAALRYKGYATCGIRAQVEALGPTWAERKVNKFHSFPFFSCFPFLCFLDVPNMKEN